MNDRSEQIVDLLMEAAAGVIPAPGRDPWEHGWCVEQYRRSDRAALKGKDGPVCMTSEALAAWEEALNELWKDPAVRSRWSEEERWGLIASLTVQTSERDSDERRPFLEWSINTFCSAGPACIVQMISNVSWPGAPTRVGDVVIGRVTNELFESARIEANGRSVIRDEVLERWRDNYVRPRIESLAVEPVAICCWTTGQEEKAIAEADRQLRAIVDLPLLLERDPRAWKIYRRGSVNRPGTRGLSLDRGAVEKGLEGASLNLELSAFPVLANGVMSASPIHWYSAEPLPLGDLYSQTYLREAIESSLVDSAVGRRIRVAARWFAQAHYSDELDDSALALGVCLDSLLGGVKALPGGVMADRVALLFDRVGDRRAVRRSYLDFYGVRSSVAHGGRSGRLNHDSLAAGFRLAHEVAWRLLEFDRTFAPVTDAIVDEVFDDLRLGIRAWPAQGAPAGEAPEHGEWEA